MSIKLIAADLDGTLLNSKKEFSPELIPLIHQLHEMGIHFAPASGRQCYNLMEMFAPVADKLSYISENGTMVCEGREVLSFETMDADEVVKIVEAACDIEGVSATLSTKEGAYYDEKNDEVFMKNLIFYYHRRFYTDDLVETAKNTPVCKVALFGYGLAEHSILPAVEAFNETSQVTLSGADWVDFMRPGMSKGRALTTLREKLGIAYDECMAFGDYLNDLELLKAVKESYAMDNAHPELKAVAKHVCPSNEENGVCRTIKKVLNI